MYNKKYSYPKIAKTRWLSRWNCAERVIMTLDGLFELINNNSENESVKK